MLKSLATNCLHSQVNLGNLSVVAWHGHVIQPGIVACTCNRAILKEKIRNNVWVRYQLGVIVLQRMVGLCDHL